MQIKLMKKHLALPMYISGYSGYILNLVDVVLLVIQKLEKISHMALLKLSLPSLVLELLNLPM
jgi:hypothetical protein